MLKLEYAYNFFVCCAEKYGIEQKKLGRKTLCSINLLNFILHELVNILLSHQCNTEFD